MIWNNMLCFTILFYVKLCYFYVFVSLLVIIWHVTNGACATPLETIVMGIFDPEKTASIFSLTQQFTQFTSIP